MWGGKESVISAEMIFCNHSTIFEWIFSSFFRKKYGKLSEKKKILLSINNIEGDLTIPYSKIHP